MDKALTHHEADGSTTLIATTPQEFALSQASLKAHFVEKRSEYDAARMDYEAAEQNARKRKWAHTTLARARRLAEKKVVACEKAIAAIDAGFCLIPPMDGEVFAIRTNRTVPVRQETEVNAWGNYGIPDEKAVSLAVSEGEYVSPSQRVRFYTGRKLKKQDDGSEKWVEQKYVTTCDHGDIDFPLHASKPILISEINRAMALRVFDEIMVSPGRKARDPWVFGTIIRPNTTGSWGMGVRLHFLIGFYQNTQGLI